VAEIFEKRFALEPPGLSKVILLITWDDDPAALAGIQCELGNPLISWNLARKPAVIRKITASQN
jgi:hypothetical protein